MYLHYNGDIQHENNILANRRKELKLTQQQVAERAGIQLRQYQRLESGDRNITGSTGRVLLAVCEALKLDPYALVGSGNEPPEVKHIVLPPIETQGLEYAIPCISYYTLVSAIPRGMVCSGDDIMKCLRKAYGMEGLEIKTDHNSAELYMNECFPFWRVVSETGCLISSFFCSKEKQRAFLENEGITVVQVGEQERFHIEDYDYRRFNINNVKIAVLKTDKQLLDQFNSLLKTENK